MAWAVAVAVGAEPMQEARPWVHAWATAWVVAVDWEPDSAWAAALAAAEALPPPMAWATAWAEAALLPGIFKVGRGWGLCQRSGHALGMGLSG